MVLRRSRITASLLLLTCSLAMLVSIPVRAADECTTAQCGAEPSADGCASAGCNNAAESCYHTLDLKAIFHHFAGDELLLKDFEDQKNGPLTYSVGGELRYRYMNEKYRLRPGGPAATDYDLWRFTPNISLNYNDRIGAFVEAIDASAFGYDAGLTPAPIDVNRADLLRYYVELNLGDVGEGNLKYRYGRQFLNYGSQHLLSPLAWANTFRNFEGHKLSYTGTDWNIDGFHMAAVNAVTGASFGGPTSRDRPDHDRTISGVYSTYKGIKNNTLDLYWLYSDEQNGLANRMDGERHTIGSRFAGTQAVKECDDVVGTWSWEAEGAYQFGKDQFGSAAIRDVQAGMFNANAGYTFNSLPWSPGVNGIFYWASGDNDPNNGDINTFFSLYPLGHAYWGQIDNLGGQNLLDYGLQVTVKPHQKLVVATQWHHFDLAQATDQIYNVVGAPVPGTGASNIGQEVDVVGTWAVSRTFNVQAGYFWFFYGDAVAPRPDASQFYVQTTWAF